MTVLDQPLKMHINQERSMKEQMDGSARLLHDKNTDVLRMTTVVSDIIIRGAPAGRSQSARVPMIWVILFVNLQYN